ncbi:universal stress protein [uncultured Pseudodesulfovibrio sp.]|uniref:universal stress protein n=1 Tax=uncultured Pseudodesulfovibrio sp. TaxID=2035858 RepID=UPI0029C896C8|nr:universal stress protein [uncultured Pseudodesulfovibrio sp.]
MTISPFDTAIRHVRAASSGEHSQSGQPSATPNLLIPLAKPSKAGAGLDFITHFFTNKATIQLTLMHIPPSQAAVWVEETNFESVDLLDMRIKTADRQGKAIVEHAGRKLRAAGFPAENIKEKVAPPQMSKAKDIIREASKGLYDAVVLGRRVHEGLAEIMDQSVCRELLEGLSHAISFPLWLCRLPEPGRTNVLLCVDGSDPSDRMADHVGFMLSHDPGHTVTVLNVHDPAKSNPLDAESIVNHAVEVMVEAGMPMDRIIQRIIRGTNPARLIREEYLGGKYAAVALGSAGADRGFWNKLFVGSVARTLFKDLRGAALWVCF